MELDTIGFVIIDDLNQPYWIRMLHGKPRMLKWLDRARKWVTWYPIDETKIPVWRERAIPSKDAEGYHKAHLETTGIDVTKF